MPMHICIVGGGLAGTVLAHKAAALGLTVTWIWPPGRPCASEAAYGMLNPVHIRNAVMSWRASVFYPEASRYFLEASALAETPFARESQVLHWLSGPDEAVLWRQQTESGNLYGYATGDTEVFPFPALQTAAHGFTRILQTVFVDIPAYLKHTAAALRGRVEYLPEPMGYEELVPEADAVVYRGTRYDRIIFAEGIYALQNPWFGALPFRPCKGDVLTLRIDGPDLPVIIHRKIFLIPLGDGLYRAGATYNWTDTSFTPAAPGRDEILESLQAMVGVPVTVVGHAAGVRPAMADRRPVIGSHPAHPALNLLNGLGSRGLMQAPLLADMLLEYLTGKGDIWPEVNVQRFKKRLGA